MAQRLSGPGIALRMHCGTMEGRMGQRYLRDDHIHHSHEALPVHGAKRTRQQAARRKKGPGGRGAEEQRRSVGSVRAEKKPPGRDRSDVLLPLRRPELAHEKLEALRIDEGDLATGFWNPARRCPRVLLGGSSRPNYENCAV
eukprot:1878526-Rhodomonas_salina.3